MEEFKVNEYISLRLKGKETFIYIQGEKFIQCKYLLLNIPVEEVSSFDEIRSIDEAAEILDNSLEPVLNPRQGLWRSDKVPPETEFWGHCSNLQVWAEMNYDTRLLHSNIAFPLLKKLTDVSDPIAKKVFKEEIGKRIGSRFNPTITFLAEEGYLDYLSSDYLEDIISKGYLKFIFEPLVEKINTIIENEDSTAVSYLIGYKYLKYLNSKVLVHLFENPKINFLDKIIFEMDDDPLGIGEWGYSFFDKIGDTISPIIRNKILSLLKENSLNDLINLWESPALNCLTTEDLNNLLCDQSIDLLKNILKALRVKGIDSMFFIGQPLFNIEIKESTRIILREKVIEIVERKNLDEISQLIGLILFDVLEEKDYKFLLKNTKFIENYIKIFEESGFYTKELDNYEIKPTYEPYDLFKRIALVDPSIFKKRFIEVINTCNERLLVTIIGYNLLDSIEKEDLIYFFNNFKSEENEKFSEKFSIALEKAEVINPGSYEDYFWITDLLKKSKRKMKKINI